MSWMWNKKLLWSHTRLHGVTNWLLSCKSELLLSKGCDWLFSKCSSSVVHHSISLGEMCLNMLNQLKPNACQCIDLIMCPFLLNGSLGGHTCAFTYITWFTTNSEQRPMAQAWRLYWSHSWNDHTSSSTICIWNKIIYKGKTPSSIQPLLTSIIELNALCFTKQQHMGSAITVFISVHL